MLLTIKIKTAIPERSISIPKHPSLVTGLRCADALQYLTRPRTCTSHESLQLISQVREPLISNRLPALSNQRLRSSSFMSATTHQLSQTRHFISTSSSPSPIIHSANASRKRTFSKWNTLLALGSGRSRFLSSTTVLKQKIQSSTLGSRGSTSAAH